MLIKFGFSLASQQLFQYKNVCSSLCDVPITSDITFYGNCEEDAFIAGNHDSECYYNWKEENFCIVFVQKQKWPDI